MTATMYMEEESIYNLLPAPEVVPERPPMYRSQHSPSATLDKTSLIGAKPRACATFGRASGLNAEDPRSPLRAHSKEPILPEPGPPSQPKEKLKAPVPKRDEKPVMGLKSSKNFITTNAVEVILASPKRAEEPLPMTMRPGFGKVPKYLKRNKEWVAQERARLDTYMRMREEEANDVAPTLSEEERADLLRHLKRKWESVNAAYQKLPFALDTRNQIRQKENLEKELAEIESDIKTLARGEIVYILPDA